MIRCAKCGRVANPTNRGPECAGCNNLLIYCVCISTVARKPFPIEAERGQ